MEGSHPLYLVRYATDGALWFNMFNNSCPQDVHYYLTATVRGKSKPAVDDELSSSPGKFVFPGTVLM